MKPRRASLAAACVTLVALAGCSSGSDDAGPDPNDKRAVAFECISNEKGIDATLLGDKKSIQVDGTGAPKVEFFTSVGEAEGKQFLGGAQNAEQIGASLLYVNAGDDKLLGDLEECLNRQ